MNTLSLHAAQRNAGEWSTAALIPGLRCAPSRLHVYLGFLAGSSSEHPD